MNAIKPLSQKEFLKIRDLLVSVCGIELKPDQDYLVETRLTELAIEIGAADFSEFHRAIIAEPELLPRVVDLMTTNETLWFRDDSCWNTLREVLLPKFFKQLEAGQPKIRVWSAASSTGQEGYSLAMLIQEECEKLAVPSLAERFEILGTDISTAAIFLGRAARYDSFTISRGLSQERRDRFFESQGGTFQLKQSIRDRVEFKHFNLMDNFSPLGIFDLVFCRNVAIYFAKDFKEQLFEKIAKQLCPGGIMLLGATESLFSLNAPFANRSHGNGLYYEVIKKG
ncbi:MAG: hypothetical protein A2508_06210 [Candidatus Lambdaproteobacteria bacterium RIFOXYD12_FULL_49_8]|uniref:protein-glutamate O-methyltransferase n=1 Tax=Candidatus Lambdaproteobacteria bacterium RIFOXYD2_FULL_50_16 TaxID=1817772 RepID=A0A1F6G6C0_9PROT|nr:MAG: hypothetical protein A2527_11095 [Candidatus Lambdaproteobacteria bacterium RIFOXYD2_FULL_50_16]OGG96424.1 MAG: hypothetical protein A2508_06210 [Candidatus Lambdaproteobacteria bacterium RIFOXYD12_FULL_49_8]